VKPNPRYTSASGFRFSRRCSFPSSVRTSSRHCGWTCTVTGTRPASLCLSRSACLRSAAVMAGVTLISRHGPSRVQGTTSQSPGFRSIPRAALFLASTTPSRCAECRAKVHRARRVPSSRKSRAGHECSGTCKHRGLHAAILHGASFAFRSPIRTMRRTAFIPWCDVSRKRQRITSHSSRSHFVARLNSAVRPHS
jgi:hypothetical protein